MKKKVRQFLKYKQPRQYVATIYPIVSPLIANEYVI